MNVSLTTYIKNLVQLVCAPLRGWEDLERENRRAFESEHPGMPHNARMQDGTDGETAMDAWEQRRANSLFYRCFLPWIAVCGSSAGVKLLYGSTGVLESVQNALVTFVSLFLAAQCAKYVFQVYMPRMVEQNSFLHVGRWMEMIVYALSFLGMIELVANVVKVRIALIEFLPLYMVFIIWKGWRYVGVAERNVGLFVIMATAAILGSTYLIEALLEAVV